MAISLGKIAKLEATVASLQKDYHLLQEQIRCIEGKNAPLEAKVKALMDKNQHLQIKMIGKMDTLREKVQDPQDKDSLRTEKDEKQTLNTNEL